MTAVGTMILPSEKGRLGENHGEPKGYDAA